MGRLDIHGADQSTLVELDADLLRERVDALYTQFTSVPADELHFEIGRGLTEALGYSLDDLALVPDEALSAFAGVGHHMDLAELEPGQRVLDIGVGSGTDTIIAARHVQGTGHVTGVDPTDAQATRIRLAAERAGLSNVSVLAGRAEALPIDDGSVDVVISNGVLNLVPDKAAAFSEIIRVLAPGGRAAISDIVSREPIGVRARCNVNLWAECVAGAEPIDDYMGELKAAGLELVALRVNPAYAFRPGRASSAADRWGVHSISFAAVLP